jgi:signal transduction histidine kinase
MGPSEQARARVLVIDDNASNRLLARSTLEDEGYEVAEASGGAEGLRLFEERTPDCVILDVRMPDMDGFEVCQRIRAAPSGREVPVLFFTALRDVDTFDRAIQVGGDDFLTKPVRPTELITRVKGALRLRQLKAEVSDHYVLLKQQRDDLQRLHLYKERLTAFVIHDLKNPVNSIDLNAQLLLRMKDLSGNARASAQRIRSDAQQLNTMILNLLDIAKADEGGLAPVPSSIDLPVLIESVVRENAASAADRRVTLRSAVELPRIQADQELTRRVLTNLVENAIRYAPEGSPVTISARVAESRTELRVADAGPGIPVDVRGRIFEPFVQLGDPGQVVVRQGRGLGLAFCKVAVELQGGRIWVEDASPGAVFVVSLPNPGAS